MARPKKEITRSKVVQVRLTESDLEQLEILADKAGMKISSFVRANILSFIQQKKK